MQQLTDWRVAGRLNSDVRQHMKGFSVALFLAMSLATAPALACSCVVTVSERTHIREQFMSSDAVFSGYVHEIHYGSMFGRDNVRMAKVRVLQVWKGALVPSSWVNVVADENTGFVGLAIALVSNVFCDQSVGLGVVKFTREGTAWRVDNDSRNAL